MAGGGGLSAGRRDRAPGEGGGEDASPPSRQERWRRDAYLAAIGELGGDEEAAAKLWRDCVDEPTRVLLDFQGRKLRGRMEELGLTIGDLTEETGIDTVRLVAVLFGQEEMGSIEWTGLSEALDVPLDWMFDGIRFVRRSSPEGRGFCDRCRDDVR
jgi:hypothetical protein